MSGIVWLASYPKSGNTWFRAFLENFQRDAERPVDINELELASIASERQALDTALGYDTADLSHDEIDLLRPDLYLYQATQHADPSFLKVHDAYVELSNGQYLFPAAATRAVLYLVRNPLDVCVSRTHHNGHLDYRCTAQQMADEAYALCASTRRQPTQLRQKLSSWSSHARSWLSAPGLAIHVMRFEDMVTTPLATFAAALRFIGLEDAPERVAKALRFSAFDELQRQEQEGGFQERYPQARAFFRRGVIGTWRAELPSDIARAMVEQHAVMMRHFGYLDATGQPVY